MTIPTDLAYAAALDAHDPLAPFRDRFVVPDPALIYLDGNSLGRLPKATAARAADLITHQWGTQLIRSWNTGWLTAPQRIGAKIAHLLGADPDEVILADSTSINLFKLAVAALRARPGRTRILTDDLNFPSDLYVVQGAIDLLGGMHHLEILPSPDGIHGPADRLAAACDAQTALLMLSHTAFKSGYVYDLAALTAAAHAAGALVLWDLSHSVGAVPLDLHTAQVDLAIGCTYKYLNGGPGAPAFLYVRRDLQAALDNPIPGWMGQQEVFSFAPTYRPAADIRRFLTGTPPVLSLALVEPGVDLLLEAGMAQVHAKAVRQTEYVLELWAAVLAPLGFRLQSPRAASCRGSHVALAHREGLGIDLALINELQVVPDFRPPETIRLGIAPLYTSYQELHTAVMRLRQVVEERRYEKYGGTVPVVT